MTTGSTGGNEPTTPTARAWHPILCGDEARAARRVVKDIAGALAEPDPSWLYHPRWRKVVSLGAVDPFTTLLFFYLERTEPDVGYATTAEGVFREARQALASIQMEAWLYGGIGGIGWLTAHLRKQRLRSGVKLGALDDALGRLVQRRTWRAEYDLISGLVGHGVYFLERLPDPHAVHSLGSIVAHLEELSISNGPGSYLLSPPNPAMAGGIMGAPHINLGVAHGIAGAIAFLGRVCAAGVAVDRARPLLDGLVAWLTNRANPAHANWFPLVVEPESGAESRPPRLGWCYGDLGLAAALLLAARCVEEPQWEELAVEVAAAASARSGEETGVVDACLCHGAAGNAHLFNRLYQATGHPKLKSAAQHWLARTLELREPGRGVAGFRTRVRVDDQDVWRDAPGMLNGAAGIGLALLAASSATAPDWDGVMLISNGRP